MPQFDSTYFASQIFWLVVCFGILMAVVGGVVVPRIQGAMNARAQHLQDMKDREASYLQQVDTLTKQMSHLKYGQGEKARHLLEEAHYKLLLERDNELKKIHDRFADQRKETLLDIEREVQKIRKNIPVLAVDIVKELTQKLILSPSDQKKVK
jgi:F-type H+-transporting ATPase subunit b